MTLENPPEIRLSKNDVSKKFVAFIDLLGFSARVLSGYEDTLDFYSSLLTTAGLIPELRPDVKATMYSDSFILVSDELGPLVSATQALLMQTLFNDCLARGGIAFGKHLEVQDGANMYVVSEALVKAASVEKSIKYPCVALHHEIETSHEWWVQKTPNLHRGLLYFGGVRLVNPCNWAWGASAETRVSLMRAESPQHREKYDWFLELHQAIFSPVPMVPPMYFSPPTDVT